ncbi:MAG: hypothetical protein H6R09_1389 [Proteobacteria bacterium]|nr:hypothetical protein [Pseudomonadota bacterium]
MLSERPSAVVTVASPPLRVMKWVSRLFTSTR